MGGVALGASSGPALVGVYLGVARSLTTPLVRHANTCSTCRLFDKHYTCCTCYGMLQVLLALSLGAFPVFLFIQMGGARAMGSNAVAWGLLAGGVVIAGAVAYKTRR